MNIEAKVGFFVGLAVFSAMMVVCAVQSWRDTHFIVFPVAFGSLAFGSGYGSVKAGISLGRSIRDWHRSRVAARPKPPVDPYRVAADREVAAILGEKA